ncbi:MAG: hypothetical protein HY841_08495 [Bacteroidetes bacterium]|nr:hypothetical protein [Bacteroidota bacterium]
MKVQKDIFIVLLVYVLLAIILFPHYKYFVDSPDALQYLVIAKKYSVGNFTEAMNSFWSPLFSWLLSILILSGIEPIVLAKVLQLVIGGFVLLGINRLLSSSNNRFIYYSIMSAVLIFILNCVLLVLTADLIFLALSIWLGVILNKKTFYFGKRISFIIIGTMGALLYFSKGIGFSFFLVTFSAYNLLLYFKKESPVKTILIKYVLTLFVFLGISSVWIYLISNKENKFVISSAASYNLNVINPFINPDVFSEIRHPYSRQGLTPPPSESSLCAWEEPQKMFLVQWSPFTSSENFIHYLLVIGKNLLSIRSFYFGLDAGTVLCISLLLLWFYGKEDVKNIFTNNLTLFVLCICCTFPYVFLLVMERYLWINTVAIAILSYYSFHRLIERNKKVGILFLSIFLFLFVKNPLIEFRKYYNEHVAIYNEKAEVTKFISGETASLFSSNENPDVHYAKSALVSYLADRKYFGMLCVPEQGKNIAQELQKFNIRYLLSWDSSLVVPDSIYSNEKIIPEIELKIYQLK